MMGRTDEVEGTLKVDVDHGIPLGLCHTHHQAVFCNACIVDENIYGTEVGENLSHDFFCLIEVGGI